MYELGLQKVPMSDVRPHPIALRQVDTTKEQYQRLKNTIKERGFQGAITGRSLVDEVTGKPFVEIIDGLHRYTAAKELGLADINVDIVEADQRAVLELQFLHNMQKVDTKPGEFAKQLQRLMQMNPLLTVSKIASDLNVSTSYIEQRLSINAIKSEDIKALINEGRISLGNAYALAKLPEDGQAAYANQAITEAPEKFLADVNARVKAIKEAKRAGKDAAPEVFVPTAHARKFKELKEELGIEGTTANTGLAKSQLVTKKTDPFDAFDLGVKWAISYDPASLKAQEEDWKKKLQARKETAERKEKESLLEKKHKTARKQAENDLEAKLVDDMIAGKLSKADADKQRAELKARFDAEDAAAEAAANEANVTDANVLAGAGVETE